MKNIFDIFRKYIYNKKDKNTLCEQVLGDRGAVRFYGGLWKQKKEELEYLDVILKEKVHLSLYDFISLCYQESVLYDLEERKANETIAREKSGIEKKNLRSKAF